MSRCGADEVVDNCCVMGPAKAALEAACNYLAVAFGPRGIPVHPISPGSLKTRPASGLERFDLLLEKAVQTAPTGERSTSWTRASPAPA